MSEPTTFTAFKTASRPKALAVLVMTVGSIGGLLMVPDVGKRMQPDTATGQRVEAPPPEGHDLKYYRRIVECVHGGESYYDAARRELPNYGFPIGSLFNWRPPTYAWVIGKMPSPGAAQLVLVVLALVAVGMSASVIYPEGGGIEAACGGVLLGANALWCVEGEAFLAAELWAGVLILLSLAAYGKGQWQVGWGAGMGALFFRELAGLYTLFMGLAAIRQRRWREVALWAVGAIVYLGFMLYHRSEVLKRIPAGETETGGTWLALGGPRFILNTSRMDYLMFSLPGWVAAVWLPLCLLGLIAWRSPWAVRVFVTAGGFLAIFAFVGRWNNEYWGLLFAPLLTFGSVRAPQALRDLVRAAFMAPRVV